MFFKVLGVYDVMVSVPRLRGLHSYIMLNENDVTFTNNVLDCQATVVLGPNDEQVLAKRLGKNIGPKAIKIQDPGGSYWKTRADKHFQVLQRERGEHAKVVQDIGTETLNEFLDGDSKEKKEHARKALARGAPKRKAKSLVSVIMA